MRDKRQEVIDNLPKKLGFRPRVGAKRADGYQQLCAEETRRKQVEKMNNTKQPAPEGVGRDIGELVKQDVQSRIEKGISTYGEPLRAFNGRSAMQDLYEELLDACMYVRQALEERGTRGRLGETIERLENKRYLVTIFRQEDDLYAVDLAYGGENVGATDLFLDEALEAAERKMDRRVHGN